MTARRGLESLLLAYVVLFGGCPERDAASSEQKLPDQVIEEFVLDETATGRHVFRLEAAQALVYDAEGRVEVRSPHVTFFDDDGSVFSTMVADSGTILSKNEDLVARGRVKVETAEGTSLATDSLTWNNRAQVVQTDAPVAITTPNGHIEGQGLISDAGLSTITVKSEVRGTANYEIAP